MFEEHHQEPHSIENLMKQDSIQGMENATAGHAI